MIDITDRYSNPEARRDARATRGVALLIAAFFACLAVIFPASHALSRELQETFAAHDPKSARTIDHSVWDRLLKAYLRTDVQGLNRFDYAGLRAKGLDALKTYLARLQAVDPAKLSRDEQFAFWTNLYNAKTVEIVADHYPVRSIRDIRLGNPFRVGPWTDKVTRINGVPLSLDDIEHAIMRPIWRDARIHYAVNCAAVGCPNLLDRAYTAAELETMLEEAARAYVNSPRGVRVEDSGAVVSSIYDWYADDFGGDTPYILAHIRKYASPGLKDRIAGVSQISAYEYDWNLNDKN